MPAHSHPPNRLYRPNVLLFLSDDLGTGDISGYGHHQTTLVSTPHVDQLARDGALFSRMHSPTPLCAPSRYGLLTGNLPMRGIEPDGTWMIFQPLQLRPGQRTTGHVFAGAGYATGLVGKTNIGGGMRTLDGSAASHSDAATADWLRGLQGRDRTTLGFDYVFESHDGIQAPPYIYWENGKPVDSLVYHGGDASSSVTTAGRWTWAHATTPPRCGCDYATADDFLPLDADGDGVEGEHMRDSSPWTYGYLGFDTTRTGEVYISAALNFIDAHAAQGARWFLQYCSQAAHVPHTPAATFYGDNEPVRGLHATRHLDMVYESDLQLGLLLARLDSHAIANVTLAIFTSDNGGTDHSESVGHRANGPLRGYKGFWFEGGHTVPFVARWPGVLAAGVRSERLASLTDVFATLVELLRRHEEASQGLDSRSFYGCLVGDAQGGPACVGDEDTEGEGVVLVQTTNDGSSHSWCEKPQPVLSDACQQRRSMVALSPNGGKVHTTRPTPDTFPEAAAIADEFDFVDLTNDPSETSVAVGLLADSAPPEAAALRAVLAAKMELVSRGERTTPPLEFERSRSPRAPPPPVLPPALPPAEPAPWCASSATGAGGVNGSIHFVNLRQTDPTAWCSALNGDAAGCSRAYLRFDMAGKESHKEQQCAYAAEHGRCDAVGAKSTCFDPKPPLPREPPLPPPTSPQLPPSLTHSPQPTLPPRDPPTRAPCPPLPSPPSAPPPASSPGSSPASPPASPPASSPPPPPPTTAPPTLPPPEVAPSSPPSPAPAPGTPLAWMRQADTIMRPASPPPASPTAVALLVLAIVLAVAFAVQSAMLIDKRLGAACCRALLQRFSRWASQAKGVVTAAGAWGRAGATRTRVADEATDANESDAQPGRDGEAVSNQRLLGLESSAGDEGGGGAAKSAWLGEDAFELNSAAAMSKERTATRLDDRAQGDSSVPPWVARAGDLD